MIESEIKPLSINYPKLMEYSSCGEDAIFLVTLSSKVCLRSNTDKYVVGEDYDLKVNLHDYKGAITLQNSYVELI